MVVLSVFTALARMFMNHMTIPEAIFYEKMCFFSITRFYRKWWNLAIRLTVYTRKAIQARR